MSDSLKKSLFPVKKKTGSIAAKMSQSTDVTIVLTPPDTN